MLEAIHSPDDLKKLNYTELNQLCREIRTLLVDTVSKTGGHLASNLGTVELSVALNRTHGEFRHAAAVRGHFRLSEAL